MIGKTLGHYQITNQLGKGGMGEVYQAKDQILGREVAIKVLPEGFARDADRVARFQREAKVLASLNHPNIAAIYGLEESAGTNFLVMELVEGQTLADRIKAGSIPVAEALQLALQIAEALEAAHERGVIHRDLKPANIKVTPDGKVKVLDFGLAKAFAGEQSDLNLTNSPTLSDAATQQGIILGTAAYMAPEQAKGKAVDKRADIWAFGVVLFEMLTGRQLFSGETVSETLAAVLMREPDFSTLPRNLHPKIIQALERCLEKEPRNRYGTIGDARVDIQKALADPSGLLVPPQAVAQGQPKHRSFLWIAAVIVVAAIVGVAVWKLKPPEPRQVMRFEYDLPEGQQFNTVSLCILAVSADGKHIVYSTPKGLYLRSLGEFDSKLIIGTETDPYNPFFSPDGKWIGYSSRADMKLKKIAISGGAPVALCDAGTISGASWGTDDRIVYAENSKGIMRISANGGIPELLVKPTTLLAAPQILPDGQTLLFSSAKPPEGNQVVAQSLKSGKRKVLLEGDSAYYLPTGHIVYMVHNSLSAIPFDLDRLEAVGGPVPLIEAVFRRNDLNAPHYAISDAGTLIYMPGIVGVAQRTLVWVDRKGKEQMLLTKANDYRAPHISPDGTKLALGIYKGNNKGDIWISDLARETITRLTFNETSNFPLWTFDSKRVAFLTGSDLSNSGVFWKAADGTGGEQKLFSAPDKLVMPWSWSSDAKILVTLGYSPTTSFDVGLLSMEGDHTWKPLLQEKYVELQPKVSPDGRWMAYMSNESGKAEIYVHPFPDINKGRWQISTNGGDSPLWSPNGRELFYRNGDSVMGVAVELGQVFKCGKPESFFRGAYTPLSLQDAHPWDISSDGKRFLMMKESEPITAASAGPRKISIVLNWIEELKQRVPVK